MSFITFSRRLASSYMRLPYLRISSPSVIIPPPSISANPLMVVRGVFSSWETFAEKSRRISSARCISVSSTMIITAPESLSSELMRLMNALRKRPSEENVPVTLAAHFDCSISSMKSVFRQNSMMFRPLSAGKRGLPDRRRCG